MNIKEQYIASLKEAIQKTKEVRDENIERTKLYLDEVTDLMEKLVHSLESSDIDDEELVEGVRHFREYLAGRVERVQSDSETSLTLLRIEFSFIGRGAEVDIANARMTEVIKKIKSVCGEDYFSNNDSHEEHQLVLLSDLIETKEFKESESDLTWAVGKDNSGKVTIYDIDSLLHLLITGAPGMGKSVCIKTIIMSIVHKANPDDVKMLMLDSKPDGLSVYNGIPHLMTDVITDARRAVDVLSWAVNEMMERYKKFADAKVCNLKGYNEVMGKKVAEGESPNIFKKMPKLVIIVDELADLISVSKYEVEDTICRLATLAATCGIHLIIATMHTSDDVIELIKTYMSNHIDIVVSGKGDMLLSSKDFTEPIRLQGAFVSDEEIKDAVDSLKEQGVNNGEKKAEIESIIRSLTGSEPSSDEDDLLFDAARFIIEKNKTKSLNKLYNK